MSDSPTHQRARSRKKQPISEGMKRGRRTMAMVQLVLLVAFLGILGRSYDLQIVRHQHFVKLSESEVMQKITTDALRAGIYDRNGGSLAISRPTSTVIADDLQISQPKKEARAMSPWVGVPYAKLWPELASGNGYQIVTSTLSLNGGKAVADHAFPGVIVQQNATRIYPEGTLAESLLGGINAQGSGSAGIELMYQKLLAGQNGEVRAFTSTSGVPLPGSSDQALRTAKPGVGLELTIDSSLQYVTEHALATEMRNTNAVSGLAVFMDVRTGQILADASLANVATKQGVLGPIPTWGQDVGVRGIQQTINNLPFTEAYEPGSVFKVVTFSAALQKGDITPSTVFAVPNSVIVGGRRFHDAENHGLEHLTATQILARSSNIGTYKVGLTVGPAGILSQVHDLGFGSTTAINFPGETAGLLVNSSDYYPSDNVALPIGQVDAVSPIQVLDAYNAIANGGVFVEPSLVRGYIYANGAKRSAPLNATHRVLSTKVDQQLIGMLKQVVLEGTGTNAIIPGYLVAGKTGTASIPVPGRAALLAGAYNASFVGFAPANAPVFSMLVLVQRPTTTIFGGSVAAPVFQAVMSYALHHYNIASSGVTQRPLSGSGASISSDVT